MEESSIPQNDHCSSWVGIDLGTTNSCLAVWRNGKVEVIANEDSNLIPTCVSFKPGEEPIVGNCARKQRFIDPENTIFGLFNHFNKIVRKIIFKK
jgi:molecular chaperone DnaK (HSP70)